MGRVFTTSRTRIEELSEELSSLNRKQVNEQRHGPIIDVEIWEYGLRCTYADGYIEDYLNEED